MNFWLDRALDGALLQLYWLGSVREMRPRLHFNVPKYRNTQIYVYEIFIHQCIHFFKLPNISTSPRNRVSVRLLWVDCIDGDEINTDSQSKHPASGDAVHTTWKLPVYLRPHFIHPRIKHSSAPAEVRQAAICHGLCPVLCLVFLVAAELWIMTAVGRSDAVWQPRRARLPGWSLCLNLRSEILNSSRKEQWSWCTGGWTGIWERSTVKTPNWLFYNSVFLWGLREMQQCSRCQ